MSEIPRRNVHVFSSSGVEVAGEFGGSSMLVYLLNHFRLLPAWGRFNFHVRLLDQRRLLHSCQMGSVPLPV